MFLLAKFDILKFILQESNLQKNAAVLEPLWKTKDQSDQIFIPSTVTFLDKNCNILQIRLLKKEDIVNLYFIFAYQMDPHRKGRQPHKQHPRERFTQFSLGQHRRPFQIRHHRVEEL